MKTQKWWQVIYFEMLRMEKACKDESKREHSHMPRTCTNEATAVLLTVEQKQYKLESERSGK